MRRLSSIILFSLLLAVLATGFAVAITLSRPPVTTQNISQDLEQDKVEYVTAKVTKFDVERQSGQKDDLLVSAQVNLELSGDVVFDPERGASGGEFRLQLMKEDNSKVLDTLIGFHVSAVYDDFAGQRSWRELHFVLQPIRSRNRLVLGEPVKGILFIKPPTSNVTYALKLPSSTVSTEINTDN